MGKQFGYVEKVLMHFQTVCTHTTCAKDGTGSRATHLENVQDTKRPVAPGSAIQISTPCDVGEVKG